MLDREIQRLGVNTPVHAGASGELKLESAEDLARGLGLGRGQRCPSRGGAIQRVFTRAARADEPAKARPAAQREPELEVQGVGDLLATYARCCKPVPPEPIVGYITVGRGVTIHTQSCLNLAPPCGEGAGANLARRLGHAPPPNFRWISRSTRSTAAGWCAM